VGVGGREVDRERDAIPVDDEVVLGAGLAAVNRVGAGLLTPLFARTLTLSTLALDQAMLASSPSQFRSVSCKRCQTPASCQSRRRRQQVEPLPQPSSLGNNRQGQPVRRTKTMPARAARSGIRGRPPLSFAGSSGSKGSIASHRSVGTSIDAFMTRDHATARRVLKHGLIVGTPSSDGDRNGTESRLPPNQEGVGWRRARATRALSLPLDVTPPRLVVALDRRRCTKRGNAIHAVRMDPEEERLVNHGLSSVPWGTAPGKRDEPGQLHSAARGLVVPSRAVTLWKRADRWVSMPNGAHGSRGRGRSGVEAGPTPAPWRSAPTS
jgi:hypothetical protein